MAEREGNLHLSKTPHTCDGQRIDTNKNAIQSDDTSVPDEIQPLHLRQLLGFRGQVPSGLIVHPDRKYIIYPAGFNIVLEDISDKGTGKQDIFSMHTGNVTALAVSPCGEFLVSGQETTVGTKAPTIMWNICTKEALMNYPLHKVKVQAICFSRSKQYFVTMGGQDDNTVVVWSTWHRKPLVQHSASILRAGAGHCLVSSALEDTIFATAGDHQGRIWKIDPETYRVSFTDLNFNTSCQRVITCMQLADYDNTELCMLFCGTTSGDIAIFHGRSGAFLAFVSTKPVPSGITVLTYLHMFNAYTFVLLLGTGDGMVYQYHVALPQTQDKNKAKVTATHAKDTKPWRDEKQTAAITSLAKVGAGHTVYIGTQDCQIYRMNVHTMKAERVQSCSPYPVKALCFARDTDDLLLTGQYESVRIFNLDVKVMQEVRRYLRHNLTCTALTVRHDGTLVFAGWDDGVVTALHFAPRVLELEEVFRILCVHKQPVTCLALSSKSDVMVSGGQDAQTRVWRLVDDWDKRGRRLRQGLLLHLLTDQAGPIAMIKMSQDDKSCACASEDGSVATYDLETGHRKVMMTVSSILRAVSYAIDDLHLVTCGSDGQIHQWEIVTQEMLRSLSAAKHGGVNCVDVGPGSRCMVSAGDDTLVKLWNLERGEVTHVGKAHSDPVQKVIIGPCGKVLVSGSNTGSLCIWAMPSTC